MSIVMNPIFLVCIRQTCLAESHSKSIINLSVVSLVDNITAASKNNNGERLYEL